MPEVSETDFAIVVFREDDGWDADVLPVAVTDDLKGFIRVLRQQPSLAGTIGLAGIDDYFFVAIRVVGNQVSVLLSDIGGGPATVGLFRARGGPVRRNCPVRRPPVYSPKP